MGRKGSGGGGQQVARYGGGGGGGQVARRATNTYERVYEGTGTVQRGQTQNQTFRQGSATVYQSMNTYESVNKAKGTVKYGLNGHMTTYGGGGRGTITQGITMHETVSSNNQVRRGTNTYETVNRGTYTAKHGTKTTETINRNTGAVQQRTSTYERVRDGPSQFYAVQHHNGPSQQAVKGSGRFMLGYE